MLQYAFKFERDFCAFNLVAKVLVTFFDAYSTRMDTDVYRNIYTRGIIYILSLNKLNNNNHYNNNTKVVYH